VTRVTAVWVESRNALANNPNGCAWTRGAAIATTAAAKSHTMLERLEFMNGSGTTTKGR
jgi:hypothetical protein